MMIDVTAYGAAGEQLHLCCAPSTDDIGGCLRLAERLITGIYKTYPQSTRFVIDIRPPNLARPATPVLGRLLIAWLIGCLLIGGLLVFIIK